MVYQVHQENSHNTRVRACDHEHVFIVLMAHKHTDIYLMFTFQGNPGEPDATPIFFL